MSERPLLFTERGSMSTAVRRGLRFDRTPVGPGATGARHSSELRHGMESLGKLAGPTLGQDARRIEHVQAV